MSGVTLAVGWGSGLTIYSSKEERGESRNVCHVCRSRALLRVSSEDTDVRESRDRPVSMHAAQISVWHPSKLPSTKPSTSHRDLTLDGGSSGESSSFCSTLELIVNVFQSHLKC